MVKSSEILKDISKWSYDGSTGGKGGYLNLIYWGEGDNKGKTMVPYEEWKYFEEIIRAFFKEIKQNPQDWKLGKHPNPDSYFECITVKHKSGRKHYTPAKHGIWGFNSPEFKEEWDEVKNILSKEKEEERDEPNQQKKQNERPQWWEKKATWLVVLGGIIVVGLMVYFFLRQVKKKRKL